MLKQLLSRKPKWQHAKTEVRKQAIEELKNTETEILLNIAKEDEEPQLRCMAVRKINDLHLLKQLSEDANWEVKQLAEQRYQQLLAGLKDEAPSLERRMSIIQSLDDEKLLEFLLQKAKDTEVRLFVLEKIDRDTVYGDVAEKDNSTNVRVRAVEKITHRPTLERVMKHSRNKDKKVYRIAKEKLEALQEAEERPKRLRAQREEVCKRLELLRKLADWDTGAQELERVQQEWQRTEQAATDMQLTTAEEDQAQIAHYQNLFNQCHTALQNYQEEQRAYAEQRTEKQTVLENIQTLLDELKQRDDIEREVAQEYETQLGNLQTRWDYSGSLPEHEEQKMHSRFKALHKQVHTQLAALRHCHTIGVALDDLCTQAEKLLEQKKAILPKNVNKLQNARQAIENPQQANAWIQQLDKRLQALNSKLEHRLEEQQKQRKHHQQMLKQRLTELETALEQGAFHNALELEKKVRDLLDQLSDLPKNKRADWEHRFHACHAKINELRGWQRWGNSLEREALCEQMESLIGIEADPEDLAKRVKDAQTEWKTLNDGKQDKKLWERFNTACQKVYAPCQQHFEQKANERQQNHEKKRTICAALNQYVEETDWKTRDFDWKAAYQHIKQQRKAWHEVGPTDRKLRNELKQQFDAVEVKLEEQLSRERKRNIFQRETLIEKARALSNNEDTHAAIDSVKELQQQWKITIPGSRKQENELWKAFQTACDAVFEKRKQERSELEQNLNNNQQAKEVLCQQLESLRNDLEASMPDLPSEWKKAEQQWEGIGEVPKKVSRKLDKRFADAVRELEKHYSNWQQQQQQAQLYLLRDKAKLCARLEALDTEQAAQVLEATRQEWDAVEQLAEKPLQKDIEKRFQAACAHASGESSLTIVENLQDRRRLLCIRMELLAGVESPSSDHDLRMSYQVERLSKAMGGEENLDPYKEATEIFQQFYLLAPVLNDADLDARFNKAWQANELTQLTHMT